MISFQHFGRCVKTVLRAEIADIEYVKPNGNDPICSNGKEER